jgi:hypothetical protein
LLVIGCARALSHCLGRSEQALTYKNGSNRLKIDQTQKNFIDLSPT